MSEEQRAVVKNLTHPRLLRKRYLVPLHLTQKVFRQEVKLFLTERRFSFVHCVCDTVLMADK